jgi:hypothetical protein
MIEKTESNIPQDPLDSLIERTLTRDAKETHDRFAVVPGERLTAKLALTTASRGLLGSLSAKLALYSGAALLVGGAVYLMPKLNEQPNMPVRTPAPTIVQPVSKPSMPSTSETVTKAVATPHVSKANSEPAPTTIAPSPKPNPIQLDEGDGKNIPTITDPHYRP